MLFVYICCRLQDNFLLLRIFNGLFIYYSATTFDNLNQCPMHTYRRSYQNTEYSNGKNNTAAGKSPRLSGTESIAARTVAIGI